MTYRFHPEAEEEFLAAIEYYESRRESLGHEFAVEVYSTILRIQAHPEAWPLLEADVRRCLTRRFPFGVVYWAEGETVHILAVMHLHRAPDYWKLRHP